MTRIIIAGGGIAGIAAAIAAAKAGCKAVVLERAAAFEEVGAGIQMGPNGRRALEALGVWEALERHAVMPGAINIRRAADGALLGQVPLDKRFRERFGSSYQVVHRADLLNALLETARATPGIELQNGRRVSFYKVSDGTISALTEDGLEEAGDALIGADGIRSSIREQLLGDGPPVLAGHVLYRALADIEEVPEAVDTSCVTLWLHRGGHVVHYPVSAGKKFNIVAAVNEDWRSDKWSTPSRGEILTEVFSGVDSRLKAVLDIPRKWLRWAGADRKPAPLWGKGRMTLIGDAAHPTLPYLASGAVMALEDAVVLGQRLTANRDDPAAAFRSYETIRQPRTARIVESSHKLAGVYHAGPPLSFFRDQFIRFSSGRRGLERMAWLYDWRP